MFHLVTEGRGLCTLNAPLSVVTHSAEYIMCDNTIS